jgi:hypothetical protein
LIGCDASADVISAYQHAHEVSAVASVATATTFDLAVLRVAQAGPACARAADAFAALFARGGMLRRKLVLLVAILESRGATTVLIDTADPGSRMSFILGAALRASGSVLSAAVAGAAILPVAAWYWIFRPATLGGPPQSGSR